MKGLFDDRTRELIAVAASIAACCEPCLEHHATAAKKAGCTAKEIKAVAALARMIRESPEKRIDELADKLL